MSETQEKKPKPTPLLRYVATETGIAMLINAALGGVITSLLTHPAALSHATYWQAAGQLVMPTLGPATAMVPGLTGITRARLAKGTAPVVNLPALRFLQRGMFARTAIIGLGALALLGSSFGWLLWQFLSAAPPTLMRMVMFMLVYGAVYGLVVAPVVIITALCDLPYGIAPEKRLAA